MITKRQLGLLLLGGGLGILLLIGAASLMRGGGWAGVGPYRQMAIAAGTLLAAVGLSLLPLGNRPA